MTCLQCLEQMQIAADKMKTIDVDSSTTLEDSSLGYTKRWNVLKKDIEDLRMQLEEIPEKWQKYNRRFVVYCERMAYF